MKKQEKLQLFYHLYIKTYHLFIKIDNFNFKFKMNLVVN